MRCDTSNRLLRNTSHDLLGGFRVVTRVMSCGEFHDLSENTCSEYRIPPQNTPEVTNLAKPNPYCEIQINNYANAL